MIKLTRKSLLFFHSFWFCSNKEIELCLCRYTNWIGVVKFACTFPIVLSDKKKKTTKQFHIRSLNTQEWESNLTNLMIGVFLYLLFSTRIYFSHIYTSIYQLGTGEQFQSDLHRTLKLYKLNQSKPKIF